MEEGKGVSSGPAVAEPPPQAAFSAWAGPGAGLGGDWGVVYSGSGATSGTECQRCGIAACRL